MRTIHRVAALAAAVVVGGVVGVSAVHYTAGQDSPEQVAAADLQAAAQGVADREYRSVIEETKSLGEGAHATVDVSLPDAREANMIGGVPENVEVEPAHCMTYLSRLFDQKEDAKGWVQLGMRPEQQSHYSALIASVPGGVSPDDILGKVRGCESGTLLITDLGVTGEFKLTVVDMPKVKGMETAGLLAETSFPSDIPEEELAARLGCAANPQTTVTEAAQACSEPREVTAQEISAARQTMSFYSNQYYFAYAMAGELLAESCEIEQRMAATVAKELIENASQKQI